MTLVANLSTPAGRRLRIVPSRLGVLSIHLDGAPCRVGCEFCYLGARAGGTGPALDGDLLEELIGRLDFAEVAVAVSEPAVKVLPSLRRIVAAAGQRRRLVAVTTTASVLATNPEILEGVGRINLSVDPRKGAVDVGRIAFVAHAAKALATPPPAIALIVSLVSPAFVERLTDGLLADLCAVDEVDHIALNGLKPPPPWCDRAFWLRTLARLGPLLDRHLDRRLFLDCYVAARILGLGGCPARPDVSTGREFRACVYQAAADFRFADADELATRLDEFTAPTRCPFPIP